VPSSLEKEEDLIEEYLPWRGDNYIQTIQANNAYLIYFVQTVSGSLIAVDDWPGITW